MKPKTKSDLTAEEVRMLFDYDPIAGELIRKLDSNDGKTKAGSRVKSLAPNGYVRLAVGKGKYLAHRLIWLWSYGVWPKGHLDHVNGIRSDNRLENLREATHFEQAQNISRAGKLLGVQYHARSKKFRAMIMVNGKQYYLGLHETPEEAHAAYCKAKAEKHTFQPTPR